MSASALTRAGDPVATAEVGLSPPALRRLRAALIVAAILPAVILGLTVGGRSLGEALFGGLILFALPILAGASRPDEDDRAAADPTRLLITRSASAVGLMVSLTLLAVPDPLGSSAGLVILTLLFPTTMLQHYRAGRIVLLYGVGVLTMALVLLAPELVFLPLLQLPPVLGLFAVLPVVERTEREGGLGRGLLTRFAATLPCGLVLLLLIAIVDRLVPALEPAGGDAPRATPSLVEDPWIAAGVALCLVALGVWLVLALRRLRRRQAPALIEEPAVDPLADLASLDALDDSPRSRILRRFLAFLAALPIERRPSLTARETSARAIRPGPTTPGPEDRAGSAPDLDLAATLAASAASSVAAPADPLPDPGGEILTPGLEEALLIFEAARYGLREPEAADVTRLERALLTAADELGASRPSSAS